jgi:hypothetical protein
MSDSMLFCNGIDAVTGDYALPPMDEAAFSRLVCGVPRENAGITRWLASRHERTKKSHLVLIEGLDPKDLAQAGWGVIFAQDVDPAVRQALAPLLEHRQAQAGGAWPRGRFRVFDGPNGYRPGESSHEFLARHGLGPGPVDPARGVPYYLLVVGTPKHIPYRFQYLLDVQFAVGRLAFDTAEEYAHYARSVVAAETRATPALPMPRSCTFFGAENEGDLATQVSARALVAPLADALASEPRTQGWRCERIIGPEATRERLADALRAELPPALLFAASHGMEFPNAHERQLAHQGALLGSAWSAKRDRGKPIEPSLYFSADDVTDELRLHGMIAFFFACYGAGTPQLDDFGHRTVGHPVAIAPHDFTARLPQRMLGRSDGALAAIGHVERAWTHSFLWAGNQPQITVFKDVLVRLLTGHPVGSAMEPMNQRYAEMSTLLTQALEEVKLGRRADDPAIGRLWTAHHDARNYVILGDPAVRLAVPVRQNFGW